MNSEIIECDGNRNGFIAETKKRSEIDVIFTINVVKLFHSNSNKNNNSTNALVELLWNLLVFASKATD